MSAAKVLVLLAFVAAVSAVPQPINEDAVVPETELFSGISQAETDSFEEAKAKISSLLAAGKDHKSCRQLADSMESDVKKDVDNNKKMLKQLTDGSECLKLGDKAVSDAAKAYEKAKKEKKDSAAAVTKAQNAGVNFGVISMNQLSPGKCAVFFEHSNYKKAKSTLDSAKKRLEKAKGAEPVAKKAYDDAVKDAAKQKSDCLCKVSKAHDKAWKSATKTQSSNQKAWTMAGQLKCILDGTDLAKCKVPACPTVSKPKLIKEAKCNESPSKFEVDVIGSTCKRSGGQPKFKGWTSWQQDCSKQDYAKQNQVADAACKKAYPGSCAITYAELKGAAGKNGVPTKNTSGGYFVANCSSKKQCLGRDWNGSKGGKAKLCFPNGGSLTTKASADTCCNSSRKAMCVV
jgi:hypothetical protein